MGSFLQRSGSAILLCECWTSTCCCVFSLSFFSQDPSMQMGRRQRRAPPPLVSRVLVVPLFLHGVFPQAEAVSPSPMVDAGEAQTGSQTAALARAPASPDDPTQTRSTGRRPRSPPRDRRPPPAMTSPLSLVSVVAG